MTSARKQQLARLIRELAKIPDEDLLEAAALLDAGPDVPRRRTARRLPPASAEAHERLEQRLRRKGIDPNQPF